MSPIRPTPVTPMRIDGPSVEERCWWAMTGCTLTTTETSDNGVSGIVRAL